MLRVLREHATSWMLRGLLILVAVTFISWGGYSLIREKKQTYAANVDGVVIEMNDFRDAYERVIKQYRDALGSSFSDKMINELRLKERILNDLVSRVLILQEGSRLGIETSDEELRETIESIPSFQIGGRFDPRTYERFLRLNRMSAEEFERIQRENLRFSKVVNLVRLNAGRISEEDVLEAYLFENERINLAFLKVAPASFKGHVQVNDIEIKDFYERNQEEFRVPTFLQVQYLTFRPSDLEGSVQISPDDVKRTYDSQKERFKTPKRVRASEILVKVSPDDPPSKLEEKKKKAEDILEKARKTKDFASLAKQVSESNSAARGGEIGWIQKGTLGEPIESTLFSLKAGDVSGVLRGREGFTIYKIDDVVEEKQKFLEEVKDQILQFLRKERAKAQASRKADDAFYSIFRSRDLEGYSKEKGVPIKTSPLFKEGDEVPEFGRNPLFDSSISSLKVGEISSVIGLPPNFYIFKLVNKKESRIPPLEEVKGEARQKTLEKKAEEMARQVAEDVLQQIRSGKEIKAIGKEKSLPSEETGFFTRVQGIVPKIGPVGEWMEVLSSLSEKNPFPKEVLRTQDGYFAVKLTALQPADQSKFPAMKKNLEQRLIYQKQEEAYQNWLNHLRAKAKIDINKDLL
jgi:peptidyl-prolyl cis-trans isomerase D